MLVGLGLVACDGGGGSATDAAVALDASTPDASAIDATDPDAATIDAAVPIDAAVAIDAALIDAVAIDAAPPACSMVAPLVVTTPHSERAFTSSMTSIGYYATFQLDTPVPLESLTFETNRAIPMHLYASCPGPHLAAGTPGGRQFDIARLEWSDGVAQNLSAGSYVIELIDGPVSPIGALDLHGVIADGAACTGPLVASGLLSCSPRANCTAGVCVVAPCGNGLDDDGDGLADDADPGCAQANDLDEADACGAGGPCPACGDTTDSDGDGQPGWPEFGCVRAADPIEHDCPDVDGVVDVVTAGPYPVPLGSAADHPSARHCWSGGADRTFQLRIPGDLSRLSIGVGQQAFTLVLYRDHCDHAPVQCFPAVPGWPAIPMTNVPAGTYWLVAAAAAINPGIYITGELVADAACDPSRPAFACSGGQSCQPASGGGHRCQ